MVFVRADDGAVIEASKADPEAFAELFDRHAQVIHRYIARRIGPQIAEDVVAETVRGALAAAVDELPASSGTCCC